MENFYSITYSDDIDKSVFYMPLTFYCSLILWICRSELHSIISIHYG